MQPRYGAVGYDPLHRDRAYAGISREQTDMGHADLNGAGHSRIKNRRIIRNGVIQQSLSRNGLKRTR